MEAAPTPVETAAKPNGPVAAALLAAGIGTFVLGVLTTWAAASESFAESLQYVDRVGPLSGKTIWAAAAFLVSWAALGAWFRNRSFAWKGVIAVSLLLIVLGLLGTFPTFFQEFAPEE